MIIFFLVALCARVNIYIMCFMTVALPFRETMVSQTAFGTYYYRSVMYQTNRGTLRPSSQKRLAKIDCRLWKINIRDILNERIL